MILKRTIIPLLLVLIGSTSCRITNCIRTIPVEIMKPVVATLPENVKTVAIFNRDSKNNHTNTLYSFGKINFVCDTTLNYNELSNSCVDGLSDFLEEEAYFGKVDNYGDSMNKRPDDLSVMDKSSDLFEITKADALIFLDQFIIENGVFTYFDATYRTKAALVWTITCRDENSPVTYNQIDTLFFNKSQYTDIRHKNQHSQLIYQDASKYLGKSFGIKLIPSWIPDERIYYKSHNPKMHKAEKYGITHDWLKAGEICNMETRNRNKKIAVKACFNMALVCEMEGKYDLAIEWLVDSIYILTKNNEHRANCLQYIKALTLRKNEITKLEKQIRN